MTTFLWIGIVALCVALAVAELVSHRRRDREVLDCGCPAANRAVYDCGTCGHTRCAEHRDDTHDCTTHMGQEAP